MIQTISTFSELSMDCTVCFIDDKILQTLWFKEKIYLSILQLGRKFQIWNITKWKCCVKYFIPIAQNLLITLIFRSNGVVVRMIMHCESTAVHLMYPRYIMPFIQISCNGFVWLSAHFPFLSWIFILVDGPHRVLSYVRTRCTE